MSLSPLAKAPYIKQLLLDTVTVTDAPVLSAVALLDASNAQLPELGSKDATDTSRLIAPVLGTLTV